MVGTLHCFVYAMCCRTSHHLGLIYYVYVYVINNNIKLGGYTMCSMNCGSLSNVFRCSCLAFLAQPHARLKEGMLGWRCSGGARPNRGIQHILLAKPGQPCLTSSVIKFANKFIWNISLEHNFCLVTENGICGVVTWK